MSRPGLAVCLAAILLAAPACAGDDGDGAGEAGGDEPVIRLVIPDNNIRVEGAECAGARPFEYLHASAPYTLESADGEVLVEGELPAGHAENAEPGTDWGVEEIPTVCVMRLALGDVAEAETYVLRLPEGEPLEFEGRYLSAGEPLQLLVE
jgi:hypothetical protein